MLLVSFYCLLLPLESLFSVTRSFPSSYPRRPQPNHARGLFRTRKGIRKESRGSTRWRRTGDPVQRMTFEKEGEEDSKREAGQEMAVAGGEGSIPEAIADYSSDVSSPRAALDITDSDSSSSSSNNNIKGVAAVDPRTHRWRGIIKGLLQRKKSIKRFSTFPPPSTPEKTRWKLLPSLESNRTTGDNRAREMSLPLPLPPPSVRWRPTWRSFELKELAAATDDFSSDNVIGRGGHAEVYRGRLPCGQLVAVKRLKKKEKEMEEERVADFLSELGIIAHVNHPNAAHLVGFGVEGGFHLVLQYSPHGSLASVLHGSGKKPIEWGVRFKIAHGVAEGLRYLHEGCHRRIIHRDIKASNILLTEDYRPQISDFGLAKWLPDNWPCHVVFPIEGTFGYLAPEYFMHGVVNENTDVFAFGVLLLELITGRPAVDSCRQSLVIWAKPLLDAGNVEGLVDPSLTGSYDRREMDSTVAVASACIHHLPAARPRMNQALQLLRGGDETTAVGEDEGAGKPTTVALFETGEDYSRSRYLSDLNRHRKLALEQ